MISIVSGLPKVMQDLYHQQYPSWWPSSSWWSSSSWSSHTPGGPGGPCRHGCRGVLSRLGIYDSKSTCRVDYFCGSFSKKTIEV